MTVTQEDFERAVLQEATEGRLTLSRLVPAIYIGIMTGDVEMDHTHLPSGTAVDFSAATDSKAARVDALLLCPTTAQSLTQAWLSGATILFCLN